VIPKIVLEWLKNIFNQKQVILDKMLICPTCGFKFFENEAVHAWCETGSNGIRLGCPCCWTPNILLKSSTEAFIDGKFFNPLEYRGERNEIDLEKLRKRHKVEWKSQRLFDKSHYPSLWK